MGLTPDVHLSRHSLGCRSPPSVLVFTKNQNGGLEYEKD